MIDPEYEFSFNMAGIDRQALLEAAATKLDELRGVMGKGGKRKQTPEGRQTRGYKNDQAIFPRANPDVYKITDQDYLARNLKAPVQFTDLSKRFNFYWIRIPVSLMPERNWGFNALETRIHFNLGDPPESLPRAYQIFPNEKYEKHAEATYYLELGIGEKFEFAVSTGTQQGQLGAGSGKVDIGVKTVAKTGLGLKLGPFSHASKKAKILHNSTGMEWVKWRLDGAEFFQEAKQDFILIAQVPKATKVVTITAGLQAYRYFNYGSAKWTESIRQLGKAFRDFFEAGMPLRDDIVPSLQDRTAQRFFPARQPCPRAVGLVARIGRGDAVGSAMQNDRPARPHQSRAGRRRC